jgi:hypothetical protein
MGPSGLIQLATVRMADANRITAKPDFVAKGIWQAAPIPADQIAAAMRGFVPPRTNSQSGQNACHDASGRPARTRARGD